MDFSDLTRSMTLLAGAVGKNMDKTVKDTAKAALRAVVYGTPVDTGMARSNWVVSLSGDTDVVILPYAPGNRLGIGESANAEAAINVGEGIIDTREPGQDIYVVNNVDYIEKLNNGSSRQAPAAFVQRAVVTAVETVQAAKVVP